VASVATALLAVLWSGQSLAQADQSDTDTDISKDVENPVTQRVTVPSRYEADFNDGAYKATKGIFSLDQAVLPFSLTEDWLLITRSKRYSRKILGTTGRPGSATAIRRSSCPRIWTRLLLGRRAGALLPFGIKLGGRRQQMGHGHVGGVRQKGREPL
jgi:hypothetical protein